MSEIPYYFKTPVPSYFYEKGWFENENTLKFVIWAFSKCSLEPRKIVHDGREITLLPFEFIAGRNSSSESCFLTPDEFRTQLKIMSNAGFLEKSPNSVPNRFTVYRWVTSHFSKPVPQLQPQQIPNSSPTHPHKLETKNTRFKEPTELPLTPSLPSIPLVGSVVEGGGGFFKCLNSIDISVADKERLSRNFTEADVAHGVEYTLAQKKKPDNLMGYLFWACKKKPPIPLKSPTQAVQCQIPKEPLIDAKEAYLRREEFKRFVSSFDIPEKARVKDIIIEDHVTYVQIGTKKIQVDSPTFRPDVGKALVDLNLWTPPRKKEDVEQQTVNLQKHAGEMGQKIVEMLSYAS